MSSIEWTAVGSIGTCLMGLLILVSLIFMLKQNKALGEQNKNLSEQGKTLQQSVHSATYQSLMQNEATYHKIMMEAPDLARSVYREDVKDERAKAVIGAEDVEIQSYWAALLILAFFENIYVQREDFKLIPDNLWPSWQAYIERDMQRYSRLREVLNDNKEMFVYLTKFLPVGDLEK